MKERFEHCYKDWLDVPCTAYKLRVSETSVRRYIKQGKIRSSRLVIGYGGNITLCNRDDVNRLIQEQNERGRI